MKVSATAPFLIVLIAAAGVGAQDSSYKLQVDVPTVSLSVEVMDSSDKRVATLTRDDFLISEDGQPQSIASFTPVETSSNVLLLIDRTASIRTQAEFLTSAAANFVKSRRPQDRVEVAEFDTGVEVVVDWNNSRVRRQVVKPGRYGGTDVYTALNWAVDQFRGIEGRKAVIVYTDGQDTRILAHPKASEDGEFRSTADNVGNGHVPFYFVAVNTDRNRGPSVIDRAFRKLLPQVRMRMESLALISGGKIFFPKAVRDVSSLYETVQGSVAESYGLTYVSPDASHDGKFHRITVRVRTSKLHVRQSRDGYYTN